MFNLILVDDEPIVLKGIQRVFDLESYGFHLVKAYSNPLTALEELSETKPDLIITDVKMPQMDGHRLTKLVKSDPALKGIPLIIFSSLISAEMRIKGKELGADEQITKPEIGKLVSIIDELT